MAVTITPTLLDWMLHSVLLLQSRLKAKPDLSPGQKDAIRADLLQRQAVLDVIQRRGKMPANLYTACAYMVAKAKADAKRQAGEYSEAVFLNVCKQLRKRYEEESKHGLF